MRINSQGYYQSLPKSTWAPLSALITEVGQSWSGRVNCFKTNTLSCTLLARWDEGYADFWLFGEGAPSVIAPAATALNP